MTIRLDIGCSTKRHKDCNLGLDKHDFSEHYEEGGFVQHDILEPLPFDDCSVEWIYCHHVLEHLPHRLTIKKTVPLYDIHVEGMPLVGRDIIEEIDALIFVINQFHRVLKVGAEAFIVVPWIEHTNAWRHPTHYRFFNYDFFPWFDHTNPTPDHEAEGLVGKWEVVENRIQDECHIVAILRKVK